jgi:hypothetical protein
LLHPDWEYLFFDDDDVVRFVHTHFPEYRNVFESFPHRIQRFDFFRYLAVLHFGGFYFDLDVFLSRNLSDLLDHECVFPFEELTINSFLRREHRIDWELGNYAFAAAPGSPFLATIVENCARAVTDPGWCAPLVNGVQAFVRSEFEVLNTTGPGAVTRTFAESTESAKTVRVLVAGDVLDPSTWHKFGDYGVHLMDGSWRSRRGFLRRKLAQYWENAQRRRLLEESRTSPAMIRPFMSRAT